MFHGKHKNGSTFGARDINTEMVTKIVPMRAVDLSIRQFCTEFWCKHFRDSDVFLDRARFFVDSRAISGWFPDDVWSIPGRSVRFPSIFWNQYICFKSDDQHQYICFKPIFSTFSWNQYIPIGHPVPTRSNQYPIFHILFKPQPIPILNSYDSLELLILSTGSVNLWRLVGFILAEDPQRLAANTDQMST